jgi:hypothetical protein
MSTFDDPSLSYSSCTTPSRVLSSSCTTPSRALSSSCTTPSRVLSSFGTAHSTSAIRHSLMNDQTNFQVMPNSSKRSKASCWKTFGFPAKADDCNPKKFEIISGFVSCKRCFDTYKYMDSSTANLNAHRCSRTESSDQTCITSFIGSPRSTSGSSKNTSKKKEELKQLCTKWIATSMRPFQIVSDPGFIRIVQACLDIGKTHFKVLLIYIFI